MIAGAVAGAVARFAVALAFLYYVSRWGGKWWDGAADMWLGAFVSGLIGLGVGGLAGATCRPIAGALLGALLSGGTCFAMFVVPAELMIGMSHPGGFDRVENVEVLYGFAAMTLAGALAGFIGGSAGRRAQRAAPDSPDSPTAAA
jgi:hypothetical protein